jgi:hypothetical protein
MQNISKRLIVAIIVFIIAIIAIVAGGWFWYVKQKMTVSPIEGEIKTIYTIPGQNMPDDQSVDTSVSQRNELDSIKDLIDGEYTFAPADTSKWQTYRNEEMGFEMKIPKDWYCGGVALDPNSKTQIACLEESQRKNYYDGNYKKNNLVMISLDNTEYATAKQLKDTLILRKKDGAKIYKAVINKKDGVATVTTSYRAFYSISNKWRIVGFPSVNKNILDGMVSNFTFVE